MMHNNLFLNHVLILTRDGKIAYNEAYHRGVNIITGDNSSGKSTLAHFIFYVLGGAFNDWVKEAKKCSVVIAEVEMNGAVMTLRREITLNSEGKGNDKEPIYIYWGNISDAQIKPIHEWQKFGYNTSESKKSFSNVFFDNLALPIVQGENNITFHQLLRLLYVDQESPTSSLFLYEQFDTTLTRETVSDLLLGIYNQQLYDDKQRKLDAEREFDDVKKEIKVIKQFIPNELDLYPEHLKQKIDNKQKEISNIDEQITELREQRKAVNFSKLSKLEFEKLNSESIIQRELVKKLDSKIQAIQYEVADTKLFIDSLNTKVRALKNSILTREFLGGFPLDYCPECLSEIKQEGNTVEKCKLCKEPIDNSFGITQARKLEQELTFQIKESKTVNAYREHQLMEAQAAYESEKINLKQIQIKVNTSLNDVRSFREEKIDKLYEDKGFLEGEILQFRTLIENAEIYQKLIQRKNELESEISKLKASIEYFQANQESQRTILNHAVEKKGLILLNNDLERQEDFIEAKEFNVDYRNNIAFIADKNAKYSASSNFYLKTSARFALFLASLEIEKMRYPRFILCDNMEDKGIEPIRAYNFQDIIIEEALKYDPNTFQMIYTTSNLPENLKGSEYIVGEYYTKAKPSLKNID